MEENLNSTGIQNPAPAEQQVQNQVNVPNPAENPSQIQPIKELGLKTDTKDDAVSTSKFASLFSLFRNKGLLIAAVIGIIAVIIGASSLFSLGNTSQYQGLIKQVEQGEISSNQ